MSDVNRRDAVKLAAGLAVGVGTLATHEAHDQEAREVADPQLELAAKSPQSFMFSEQITFKIEGDGHGRELFITSARDSRGRRTEVPVRAGSMRIFRADADLDEFTREGGLYWRFHTTQGKARFKQPGALVMIVRDHDDTVRCYSLVNDLRC